MIRVFVTGLGIVSNVGASLEEFWTALAAGKGIFKKPALKKEHSVLAGVVDDRHFEEEASRYHYDRYDRSTQMAISASVRALSDANVQAQFDNPERVAVVFGGGGGCQETLDNQYWRLLVDERRLHPMTVGKAMFSAGVSAISIATGAKGPCFAVSSACASGAHAIGAAAALVRSGLVDMAIAGGAEASLTYGALMAWDSMRIVSRSICRPFALGRDGLMISEGAGAVVLESESHARSRGADTQVEFAGFGCSADSNDMFQPSADGMKRAMLAALADARLSPSDIDYINAHGTGTRSNDLTETSALKALYRNSVPPPFSSTKGVTGHALGAAAALEAVATILALRRQTAPPTANYDAPDPECDLDCIPNEARALKIDAALSNSFAFGGLNATLAFRRSRAGS